MNEEKIRRLLNELQQELDSAEEVDPETLARARTLDERIQGAMATPNEDNAPVMDDAIDLEARFAATHPMAERIIRELIYNLGRIGI